MMDDLYDIGREESIRTEISTGNEVLSGSMLLKTPRYLESHELAEDKTAISIISDRDGAMMTVVVDTDDLKSAIAED